MQEQANPTAPKKPFKWGFASSGGVILALLVVGDIAGNLLSRWPPMRGLLRAIGAFSGHGSFEGGVLQAMVARDWLFGAFLIAAVAVVWFNRSAILRFFRAMQTGVMLIALTTLAILTGVLVPQIQNFEDPEQRVTNANHAEELGNFRWAEGYFFYHLTHLYGFGMPTGAELPPAALQGLDRFGRVYGAEEQKNRSVMMNAAFTGKAKTDEIDAFIARHRGTLDRAFAICTSLDLNRTYKSSWFATLVWLLGIGVLCNTLKYPWRVLFTFEKSGFLVTHIGMLTLLSGGLVSNLFTDRGILELHLGEPPEDTYYRHYRMDKRMRMPFSVKLDRFARKEWKAIDVYFLQEEFKSRPPRYTVWPDRRIPLDWQPDAAGKLAPQLELVVREIHDHAQMNDPILWEGKPDDGKPLMPAAQFEAPVAISDRMHAHAAGGSNDRALLLMMPSFANQLWIDPAGKFRLMAAHGSDPQGAFPAEGDDTFATLDVDVPETGQENSRPMRIRLGDRLDIGAGYQIVVKAATRDFKPQRDSDAGGSGDVRPLGEQPDGFRAVWIDVVPPGGKEPERRLVSELLDPVQYGLQDGYKYKDIVVRLRWDRWTEVGAPRFVFSWDASGAALLTGQDGSKHPVALGEKLALPGETSIVLKNLYERLRGEVSLEFTPGHIEPDGFDPSFYLRDARGIVLDVISHPRTPQEKVETIKMATIQNSQSDRWFSDDGRLGIQFLENDDGFPFDWRSVLSIVEKDAQGNPKLVDCGTEKEREIRVNDYFTYRGYRFFQTNANPKDPTYSGIGVVYDPGIEIVLLGMYTIIAGTVLAFTVRPIVRARRRAGVSS